MHSRERVFSPCLFLSLFPPLGVVSSNSLTLLSAQGFPSNLLGWGQRGPIFKHLFLCSPCLPSWCLGWRLLLITLNCILTHRNFKIYLPKFSIFFIVISSSACFSVWWCCISKGRPVCDTQELPGSSPQLQEEGSLPPTVPRGRLKLGRRHSAGSQLPG